jgi:hypothetical protein
MEENRARPVADALRDRSITATRTPITWILAMELFILTRGSWYPVYSHIAGVTLAPFADQQIGAGRHITTIMHGMAQKSRRRRALGPPRYRSRTG